jgi:hypothetical protein
VLLHDLTDFLRLSAALHMQMAAQGVGWENILRLVTNRMPMGSPRERDVLLHVFEYLAQAYGVQRRRVGPPAILHPLRATALLTLAAGRPQLLDMLTELLHDKYEDLTPEVLGQDLFAQAESKFRSLLRDIDPTDEWYLMERLDHLALRKIESYYEYVGRLLNRSVQTPELVRVKLADRLDNTLDLHIDVEDFLKGIDFFWVIFHIMFPPSGSGYDPDFEHPIASPLNGAQRLYQLFKNAVLASMHEAQRITLHIMAHHETDIDRQRALLMDVQRYAQEGGLTRITSPSFGHSLDGLFMTRFDHADPVTRDEHLDKLYKNKGLMLQAAVGFVVIFLNFVHSPDYWIHGISDRGMVVTEQ